jgi:hypothetical protein
MQLQRKPRPKFAAWRYDFGLTVRATADRLEQVAGYRICSHEKVRTISLPFGDPEWTAPDADLAQAIETLTEGEITAEDFRQPEGVVS